MLYVPRGGIVHIDLGQVKKDFLLKGINPLVTKKIKEVLSFNLPLKVVSGPIGRDCLQQERLKRDIRKRNYYSSVLQPD